MPRGRWKFFRFSILRNGNRAETAAKREHTAIFTEKDFKFVCWRDFPRMGPDGRERIGAGIALRGRKGYSVTKVWGLRTAAALLALVLTACGGNMQPNGSGNASNNRNDGRTGVTDFGDTGTSVTEEASDALENGVRRARDGLENARESVRDGMDNAGDGMNNP